MVMRDMAHLNESDFTVTAHFYCKHSLIPRCQKGGVLARGQNTIDV